MASRERINRKLMSYYLCSCASLCLCAFVTLALSGNVFWKNKANLLAFSVLRSADSVKLRKRNLKKQSQFAGGQNELKCLYERWLWRISCFETAKKQSQFKAKQSQFHNPTPRQGYEKGGAKNECRFLEPYIGDRTVYWSTGPFSKAISRGENAPGQGEAVIFEKMLAPGAKCRYHLGFGILSLVYRSMLRKTYYCRRSAEIRLLFTKYCSLTTIN